jgi:hypothetical protein
MKLLNYYKAMMKRRISKEEKTFNSLAPLGKKKAEKKSTWYKKCDKLFSIFIHIRDERCVKCGRLEGKFDNSHVISRTYKRLRYDPRNANVMCFTCHRWWHDEPAESGLWYRTKYPEDWEYLSKEKQKGDNPLAIWELKEIYEKYLNLIYGKK